MATEGASGTVYWVLELVMRGSLTASTGHYSLARLALEWCPQIILNRTHAQKYEFPASCPPAHPLRRGAGALLRAAIWGSLHNYTAGVPRYAQANAPHRRGANAGPTGVTRAESIDDT